jgi:serine/threonine protein phosphatase PrpC
MVADGWRTRERRDREPGRGRNVSPGRSSIDTPDVALRVAVEAANRVVHDEAQLNEQLAGMGTTGVAALFTADGVAFVANVGDSRAYRMRDGALEQITLDHSMVAELQRRGMITEEEALVHPRRNEVLRSLGVEPDVQVDLHQLELAPGDLFLLCSDGLSGVVRDVEIAEVMHREAPAQAVRTLVDFANGRGGPDNVTVQIARIPGPETERSGGSASRAGGTSTWTLTLALVGARSAGLGADRPARRAARARRGRRRSAGGARGAPEDRMNPTELTQIGPYRVRRFVAEGGMAWVFEVVDPRFDATRALKMLKPTASVGDDFTRFEAEASLLAGISHPNLITIFDFGRDDATGCYYYTMTYVDSPPLSQRGVLTLEQAGPLFLDVLAGLAVLHERGVVHRDIARNVLLTTDGRAVLADLGTRRPVAPA